MGTTHRYWRLLPILSILALFAGLLSAAPARAASGTVTPQTGGVGTRFNFSADGFTVGERIDFWVTGPDGSVAPRYPSVKADGRGAVVWSWDVAPGTANGHWDMTARGIDSDSRAVIGFTVGGSTPTTLPNSVTPASGAPGTTFSFTVGGLKPGERVGAWLTQPDGQSRDFDPGNEFRAYADANGSVSWTWKSSTTTTPGDWRANARGLDSTRQVSIAFRIVGEQPAAPGRSVTPASGAPGTTFTVTAAGFTPGEQAGSWLNRPDGKQINATPYLHADARGVVTWTWQSPTDAVGGIWQAVTRGKDSQVQAAVSFTVTGSNGVPGAPVVNGSASPQGAVPGATISFTAGGFTRYETVNYWVTTVEGKVLVNTSETEADVQGSASWSWRIPANSLTGQWTMTARGADSHREVMIPFTVLPGAPATTSTVTPPSGGPGTTFAFSATGFREKSERIFFWFIDPNGKTVDGPAHARSEQGGSIRWEWTAPASAVDGRWQAVAHGDSSGFDALIPFTITRAAPLGIGASVSPESGGPGTTFTFTANGYKPDERVGYWLNLPDGKVVRFDHELRADSKGVVTWTWVAPADAPRGLYVMAARSSQNDKIDNDVSYEIRFTLR